MIKMRHVVLALVVFAPALAVAQSASAQTTDRCRDVLIFSEPDLAVLLKDEQFVSAYRRWACRAETSELKKHREMGLVVPIPDLPATVGADFDSSVDRYQQSSSCEGSAGIDLARYLEFHLMRTDATAIDAWTKCMEGRGGALDTWTVPSKSVNVFEVHLAWRDLMHDARVKERIALPAGVTSVPRMPRVGSRIAAGDVTYVFTRAQGDAEEKRIAVNVEKSGHPYSATIVLPPVLPPQPLPDMVCVECRVGEHPDGKADVRRFTIPWGRAAERHQWWSSTDAGCGVNWAAVEVREDGWVRATYRDCKAGELRPGAWAGPGSPSVSRGGPHWSASCTSRLRKGSCE